MSPPCGSVTELSDHGFCEDDLVSSQRRNKVGKTTITVTPLPPSCCREMGERERGTGHQANEMKFKMATPFLNSKVA